MKKAIFLDRDGTIIIDKIYLNDASKVEYLPGVFPALKSLYEHKFELVVVTNQSGIAKRIVDLENLDRIHAKLQADACVHGFKYAGFYYAPYSAHLPHPRRKPEPGLILEAALDHGLDPSQSWMVGDRMTDVEAGHRAGCQTVLLGNTERPEQFNYRPPELWVPSLVEAAQEILNKL